MKRTVSLVISMLAIFATQPAWAQDAEMADGMRASGKIYVVVGIIVIVLIGLVVYLFMMDQKLTRIEKQLSQNNKPKSF